MKQIPLTQGKFALVDDEDFELLSKYRWHILKAKNTIYAVRKALDNNGNWRNCYMHRFLLGISDRKVFIDHKNGNGLDNTRLNIRVCSNSENQMNARTREDNSTGFKGVSFHCRDNRFQAYITVNGKRKHLGYFESAEKAFSAYVAASKIHHGEFSKISH